MDATSCFSGRSRASYTRSTQIATANFCGRVALGTADHSAAFNGEAPLTAATLTILYQTMTITIRSQEEVCSPSTCGPGSKPGTRRRPSLRALAHSAAVLHKWRPQPLFPESFSRALWTDIYALMTRTTAP